MRKANKKYWELILSSREFSTEERLQNFWDYCPVDVEVIGLYCSKNAAECEKDVWLETHEEMVNDGRYVSLKVRKMKNDIEEIELVDYEEMNLLMETYG